MPPPPAAEAAAEATWSEMEPPMMFALLAIVAMVARFRSYN